VWNLIGLVFALVVGAFAWQRSRRSGGYYDAQVYAMSAAAHRGYALASLAFAAFFACAFALRLDSAGVAGLALYAVVAIFYIASFLRGASDDDG
jgi:hypothetical protein